MWIEIRIANAEKYSWTTLCKIMWQRVGGGRKFPSINVWRICYDRKLYPMKGTVYTIHTIPTNCSSSIWRICYDRKLYTSMYGTVYTKQYLYIKAVQYGGFATTERCEIPDHTTFNDNSSNSFNILCYSNHNIALIHFSAFGSVRDYFHSEISILPDFSIPIVPITLRCE